MPRVMGVDDSQRLEAPPRAGALLAKCYTSLLGGSMVEMILLGLMGGLFGSGLALIGVPQVRIFDCVIAFGMLLLLLVWVASS